MGPWKNFPPSPKSQIRPHYFVYKRYQARFIVKHSSVSLATHGRSSTGVSLHRSRMGDVHRPSRSSIEDHQTGESPDKSRIHCHNQLPQLQRRFRRILPLIPVPWVS